MAARGVERREAAIPWSDNHYPDLQLVQAMDHDSGANQIWISLTSLKKEHR